MSRGAPPRPASALSRLADLGAKLLLPAGAALTLLVVVRDSARSIDHDLQLVAPARARAGDTLPVRGLLYAGLQRAAGPQLATAEVALELRAAGGRVLARAPLRASFAQSMDALLVLPAGYAGRAQLRARAEIDGDHVLVARALQLDPAGAAAPPAPPPGERPLPPLQRLVAGPVRAAGADAQPPGVLALAIEGGACVPERPCRAFLHVGAPAAAVRVLATPSVTPAPASARPSAETSGVLGLGFTTHGPEAELQLEATRAGVVVASRAYRLAVALGAVAARELPALIAAPARPPLGLLGDERGCIVDGFLQDRWLRTGALRACDGHEPLPFAALQPGLWRLQLRRDPFAAQSAAVRSLYVTRAGQRPDDVLVQLAAAVLARAPDDALARAVSADPGAHAGAQLDPTAHYLLSRLDAGIVALPPAASSYPAARARLAIERTRLRKLSLLALALCAFTLGLLVAQRGLRAVSQAGRLMAEAGQDARELEHQRLRRVLRVMATVTSLLLAFVAIAVYMVARSHGP